MQSGGGRGTGGGGGAGGGAYPIYQPNISKSHFPGKVDPKSLSQNRKNLHSKAVKNEQNYLIDAYSVVLVHPNSIRRTQLSQTSNVL